MTRRGKKFELDRSEWTTYPNFCQMYDLIIDEMIYCNLAKKLDQPQWQNKNGQVCDEEEAFGCKVTHRVTLSDMFLVMDEVGSDTSQKGGGAVGGEKIVCGRGTSPKEKCSSKSKHWTLIGLTSLSGDPVMCICIFSGLNRIPLVETGMDIFAETVGDVLEPDFFQNYGAW